MVRVVNEKNRLDEKRAKLEEFLKTDAFKQLDPEQSGLLVDQQRVMFDYSGVLGRRIALFPEASRTLP